MRPDGLSLAQIDRAIAELHARTRVYLDAHRASRRMAYKDPPRSPDPSPSPPPLPSFPRESLVAERAAFVVASARRARGESPPEPEQGEDGDRDKPEKEPPEPGSLILDAVRRRQGK
jgi:hypothetical protein